MNTLKIIKTGRDYADALNRELELTRINPKPDSEEGEELELLTLLIKKYEEEILPSKSSDKASWWKMLCCSHHWKDGKEEFLRQRAFYNNRSEETEMLEIFSLEMVCVKCGKTCYKEVSKISYE